jgi:hypothetical protein
MRYEKPYHKSDDIDHMISNFKFKLYNKGYNRKYVARKAAERRKTILNRRNKFMQLSHYTIYENWTSQKNIKNMPIERLNKHLKLFYPHTVWNNWHRFFDNYPIPHHDYTNQNLTPVFVQDGSIWTCLPTIIRYTCDYQKYKFKHWTDYQKYFMENYTWGKIMAMQHIQFHETYVPKSTQKAQKDVMWLDLTTTKDLTIPTYQQKLQNTETYLKNHPWTKTKLHTAIIGQGDIQQHFETILYLEQLHMQDPEDNHKLLILYFFDNYQYVTQLPEYNNTNKFMFTPIDDPALMIYFDIHEENIQQHIKQYYPRVRVSRYTGRC